MKIQHNISALNTFRQMGVNNTGTAKSLEKLSSGYRINRAGDDAAGLAISEKMRAQTRGLNRASSNAQDGISLIQAAEGALQETHSILQRMRELGIQAANDVNELEDRNSIQDELNRLKTEVDRIAHTTEFNKKTVLDGSLSKDEYSTKLLAGTAVLAGVHMNKSFALTKTEGEELVDDVYTVAIAEGNEGKYTSDTYAFDLTGAVAGDVFSINVTAENADALPGGQNLTEVNVFTYTATGSADVDNAAFINGLKEALGKIMNDYDVSTTGNTVTFMAKGIGEEYANVELAMTATYFGDGTAADEGTKVTEVAGQNATITITGNVTGVSADITTARADGFYVNGKFSDAGEDGQSGLVFEVADLTKMGSAIVQVTKGKDLTLQVGANTTRDQTIDVNVKSISASSLGIDNLRVDTQISSVAAVAAIEQAIQTVSEQRSALGAVQNRLEHTVANLDTVSENLQDAESRIRDVDMAKEMMNFTKFNILQQASQAMMAQANSMPQGVLQLLR